MTGDDPAATRGCGRPTLNDYLNWTVLVLAFALPLYRKWVSIAVPLIFILWLAEGRLGVKAKALKRHPLTLAILAFIAVNLLSLLWTSDPLEGFLYIAKYRYLLLVPVLATSLRPHSRDRALTALAAGTLCSLALLFANAAGLLPGVRAPQSNPAVTMSHLDYSVFLALAVLLAVNHLLLGSPGRLQRALWASFAVAAAAGLFVNLGRSGQLAFFGALLTALPFYLRGRRWRAPAAVAVVAVVLLTAYVVAPVFRERLESAVLEVDQALEGHDFSTNQGKRIAGMIVATTLIREHPVLGTGVVDNMREFRALLDGPYRNLRDAVAWFPHLHNQYLQVVTEIGLVGLAALLMIFVQLFRVRPPDREARVAMVILGAVFLFAFLGDPYLHKQLPVALFGCLGGLYLAPSLSVWRELAASPDCS